MARRIANAYSRYFTRVIQVAESRSYEKVLPMLILPAATAGAYMGARRSACDGKSLQAYNIIAGGTMGTVVAGFAWTITPIMFIAVPIIAPPCLLGWAAYQGEHSLRARKR
jgi:hypothetical protein